MRSAQQHDDPARAVRQADRRGRRSARCPALEDARGDGRGQRRRRSASSSTPAFVRAREPHVAAVAALSSPSTGIVWPEGLVNVLRGLCDAARRGVAARHRRCAGAPLTRSPRADDRARADRRVGRRQRRRACTRTTCRRCSAASRSRSIRAAASTRSSRRTDAIDGQRARLSRAAQARAQPWRPPRPDRRRRRAGGSDDPLPGAARRTTNPIVCRSRSFVEPTARMLPGITIDDLRLAAAASAPSCARRIRRSRTS